MRQFAGSPFGLAPTVVAVRGVVGLIGFAYVVTGSWALIAPTQWVRSYPGFGRHWLRPEDAASTHFVADAGAGFLAVGLVLLVAVAVAHRVGLQIAAIALAAHAGPHFVHHLAHPDRQLPTVDVLLGVWGLALQAVGALVALIWLSRPSGRRT